MSAGSRKMPPPIVTLTMPAARPKVPMERMREDSVEEAAAGDVIVRERNRTAQVAGAKKARARLPRNGAGDPRMRQPRDRGRDDVGPGRRLRAVENGPSAARLTMRRRLGGCRAPVKHRFGHAVARPPGDESAPPPMGPAAGPFFDCAVTALTRRPGPTSSRPRVIVIERRSCSVFSDDCSSTCRHLAPREPRRGWLVRPVERADARRSRNGGAAIPRVVFRPCDPCRR